MNNRSECDLLRLVIVLSVVELTVLWYCKSHKFRMGFILRTSQMNCFSEIKYHANILAVYCNKVTNSGSAKLNSNEVTFTGKTTKYNAHEIQGFYSKKIWMTNKSYKVLECQMHNINLLVCAIPH